MGLVAAHWFAFSLAAIATDTTEDRKNSLLHSAAGIAGAASVGMVLTVTSWLVPAQWEALAITIALIGYISIAAITIARSRKAGWLRGTIIVVGVLTLSFGIVFLKNFLGAY
ncbi:hypothetical protein [Pelagibacterium lacus]|uniref:hypothetical protein n=1 Tax=Pelagibacterium lacus TaxID=2282655 RepID=UPI0011C03DB8|nr:hypothetical protein [Pelagibacterium lacus]